MHKHYETVFSEVIISPRILMHLVHEAYSKRESGPITKSLLVTKMEHQTEN